MKTKKFTNTSEYLNLLRGIFYIFVGIPLFIFIIIFFLYRSNNFEPIYDGLSPEIVQLASLILIILGALAFIYYFRHLPKARKGKNLREKLNVYYSVCFTQFAMISVVSIIDLILFFVSGHKLFAGVYILLLIMLALNNPSYYNVVGNLKLLKEEREIMKNNKNIA